MLLRRDENGFAILGLLAVIGLASSVIVGGFKTAASIYDQQLTTESTSHLYHHANVVRDKGVELGGEEGKALIGRARRITKVANMLRDQATDQVISDIATNVRDLALIPVQGGPLVKTAEAVWNIYGLRGIEAAATDAWTPTDAAAIARMSDLQQVVDADVRDTPVGEAIAEAKVRSMRNAVDVALPDWEQEEIDALLADAVIEMANDEDPAPERTNPFQNPAWSEVAEFVGIPELPTPPPDTTTTTTTTTTVPERPAEPLRLTWACQHLADGHDVSTISITNVSGSTIEGIHLENLVLPDENWTPTPPNWTLDPGETISAVAKFRVSYYGLESWDVATGRYAEDGEEAYSNRVDGLLWALSETEGDPDEIAACLASQDYTIVSGPTPHGWNEEEIQIGNPERWAAPETVFFWEVTAQILKPDSDEYEWFTWYVNDCGRCTDWWEISELGDPYYGC